MFIWRDSGLFGAIPGLFGAIPGLFGAIILRNGLFGAIIPLTPAIFEGITNAKAC
jgi:hypothetical protein